MNIYKATDTKGFWVLVAAESLPMALTLINKLQPSARRVGILESLVLEAKDVLCQTLDIDPANGRHVHRFLKCRTKINGAECQVCEVLDCQCWIDAAGFMHVMDRPGQNDIMEPKA